MPVFINSHKRRRNAVCSLWFLTHSIVYYDVNFSAFILRRLDYTPSTLESCYKFQVDILINQPKRIFPLTIFRVKSSVSVECWVWRSLYTQDIRKASDTKGTSEQPTWRIYTNRWQNKDKWKWSKFKGYLQPKNKLQKAIIVHVLKGHGM